MKELPSGWADVTLGDVTAPRGEKADPKSLGNMPFLGMDHVKAHTSELLGTQPVTEMKSSVVTFKKGDLLYGRLRPYLNKVHLAEFDGAASAEFIVFPPSETIEQRFLQSLLRSPKYRTLADERSTGDRPRVKFDRVRDFEFALPPLAEQKRIVRKLNTLRACTNNARSHLNAIHELIEQYRQKIFDLAFSGALTQTHREKNGAAEDGGLPTSWRIKELGELAEIQSGIQIGKKRPPRTELVEVPYLRVANVQRGWLDLDEVKVTDVTEQEKERLLLRKGDILMNEGGDRDKLGRGWVWSEELPDCIHQNHVFRIRLRDRNFPPEYISHFANAKGQKYFFDEGTQTTNLASISKRKVSGLPVRLPPADEARQISLKIEAAFSRINRLAAEAEKALQLSYRLDERILVKALEGALVPQDPNDEPASVLLDRTRHGRISAPKTKRQAGRRQGVKKKHNVASLIDDWPPSGMTFAELRERTSGTYDQVKEELFNLMTGDRPKIYQEFDKTTMMMRLKRVTS